MQPVHLSRQQEWNSHQLQIACCGNSSNWNTSHDAPSMSRIVLTVVMQLAYQSATVPYSWNCSCPISGTSSSRVSGLTKSTTSTDSCCWCFWSWPSWPSVSPSCAPTSSSTQRITDGEREVESKMKLAMEYHFQAMDELLVGRIHRPLRVPLFYLLLLLQDKVGLSHFGVWTPC